MENVKFETKGDVLTITVNMKKRGGLSPTGKTIRIASTMGNQVVPGTNVTVGLNVYTKEGVGGTGE